MIIKKFYKINEDGLLSKGSGTIIPSGFSENWSLIQLKEDGSEYIYYNADGTPDLIKEQELIDSQTELEFKEYRQLALDCARVECTMASGTILYDKTGMSVRVLTEDDNKVGFDANELSRSRLKEVVEGLTLALTDPSTEIPVNWILYDNTVLLNFNFTLANEAYIKARNLMAELWTKTTIQEIEDMILLDTEWTAKFNSLRGV